MFQHRIFYGWWIVAACLVSALIGNALGLFGAGVYLRALSQTNGWPIGLISGAATLFYVVSAVLLIPGGGAINRFGPRPVIGFGGVAMAGGVAGIGQVTAPWQAYLAFFAMGIGRACLSTNAALTTIRAGFAITTAIAGSLAAAVLLPLAVRVMRHRPVDIGLFPDGAPAARAVALETRPP